MDCGLDFGTSHCALGVMEQGNVKLVPLHQQDCFMPSTLYSFDRGLISPFIYQIMAKHSSEEQRITYQKNRSLALQKTASLRRLHDLQGNEPDTFVGKQAIDEYIDFPEEGFFVKSPKSFLGANGLQQSQIDFFEDIVTAMMIAVKQRAELHLQTDLRNVVIGRPVNFQGANAEKSNQQATAILTNAAKRCGYQNIEFLFEPLAAGIDFESQLNSEKTVLVVDIGGGTTDCSMVRMGPERQKSADRQADFLAHTGKRVGGNDLDIFFAFKHLMPLFGLDTLSKSNKTLPRNFFWNAVSTNDVSAQSDFFSQKNANALEQLSRDAQQGNLIKRLIKLQKTKQNHRLVRDAELNKIALSEHAKVNFSLDYIESALNKDAQLIDFSDAIQQPLFAIKELVSEAVKVAAVQPDIIYLTGGSAKSSVLRQAVIDAVNEATGSENNIPLLDGDYFGSVTAGLTKWSDKIFA